MADLDGKGLSRTLNKSLKARITSLPRAPSLAVVLVGADPASQVYVRQKGRVAGRIGITHEQIDLPADASLEQVIAVVDRLNADDGVDGILVQLPLPAHLRAHERDVLDRIDRAKDVDGFHPANAGLLSQGRPFLVPCTPLGVMVLLEHAGVELSGKHAVVIGRSNIVGRPMAQLLEQANCTVSVAHSRTRDVESLVGQADVVVAAVGRPHFVKGSWLRDGAVGRRCRHQPPGRR